MARRVFFSFHYQNDIWRVSQIRNSWVTKDRETAGFWDAAAWESVKSQGENAIKRWIDTQLQNTSVTIVLIGSQTAERFFVKYEIQKSYERGNGLLGIYINNLKDRTGLTSTKGANPFAGFYITQQNGNRIYLSQIYPSYDWVADNGQLNLATWIEQAAQKAGR